MLACAVFGTISWKGAIYLLNFAVMTLSPQEGLR